MLTIFLQFRRRRGGGGGARRREGSGPCVSGTSGALRKGMHRNLYGLKRAFQSTLRLTRPILTKMGLTAARYDLLYALWHRRVPMWQAYLRRVLGVTRATVSRMLGSLEELGYVARKPDPYDRRGKLVELTALGRERITFAHRRLVRSRWLQLAIDSAMGVEGQEERWYEGPCFKMMAQLDNLLNTLRRGFYDLGSLEYPWPPPARRVRPVKDPGPSVNDARSEERGD